MLDNQFIISHHRLSVTIQQISAALMVSAMKPQVQWLNNKVYK